MIVEVKVKTPRAVFFSHNGVFAGHYGVGKVLGNVGGDDEGSFLNVRNNQVVKTVEV